MKPAILSILLSLFFSSCATLFNSKVDKIHFVTNEPTVIRIGHDTLPTFGYDHLATVARSKDSLEISAISESKSKQIKIPSKNSFAYWLNLYPATAWTGFIVDQNNPKRYSYPRKIYIDLGDSENSYLTYEPLDSAIAGHSNLLKMTPLRAVSIINPGVELTYERKLSNRFTSQIMASYLLPVTVWGLGYEFRPEIKGYQIAFEQKYYLQNSAPLGPYLSFEFNYLQNKYRNIGQFTDANQDSDAFLSYTDTIGIHKKTYSSNLKLGYQFISKRLAIDIYAGLGARYKDVIHTDKLMPEDQLEMPRHPNVLYITNRDGKYWTWSTPLNVRLGWRF